jgi:hypothetical protein
MIDLLISLPVIFYIILCILIWILGEEIYRYIILGWFRFGEDWDEGDVRGRVWG